MMIERDPNGDFILDSSELAQRFGLSLADLRRHMRHGSLVSSVEIGTAEHEGTKRVSLRLGNRLWRAVLNDENEVQHEEMTVLRANAPRWSRR
ncbi:hypothetical protein ATY76_06690 [Rhizobium sp. R339]|uniref:DUF6522 family protein n=1 Tax=Rhizobium sp. R339 TaxID=1764273 RepID=UPI000B52F57F|nr:DUF6522 family protein [Rhizobium sp. R339]OWV72508.1 hypothetical protein ATY76_06690 [Rhizobium sp. R339]